MENITINKRVIQNAYKSIFSHLILRVLIPPKHELSGVKQKQVCMSCYFEKL